MATPLRWEHGSCPICHVFSEMWIGHLQVGKINSFGAFPVEEKLIAVTCPSCGTKFEAEEKIDGDPATPD